MTIAELNRKFFDSISDTYESKPWWTTVNNKVANTLRSDLFWLGIPFANTSDSTVRDVRLLDYACGTGLMTRVFSPYVTKTRGIDVSPNMVTSYNNSSLSAGLDASTVYAVTGELFNKSNPSPTEFSAEEWWNFDLVTVGFAFHHFEDVVFAASQLKDRLRPGGVLVINDFLEGGDCLADEEGRMVEGSEGNHAVHGHGHGHKHHHHQGHAQEEKKHDLGETNEVYMKKMKDSIVVPHFTLDGVKGFLSKAGFVDVDVKVMDERVYMEFGGKKLWRRIFFAKGKRPFEEKSEL